jgi:hypothetical protein
VFPFDAFGNPLPGASGFAVTVEGLSTASDGETRLTKQDSFTSTITIPKDFDATLVVTFTLDGVPIGDGEPVHIVVTPPPAVLNGGNITIGIFGILFGVAAVFAARRYSKKVDSGKAVAFSRIKEIGGIYLTLAGSIVDPLTDFLNWLFVMMACEDMLSGAYLFLVVMSVFGSIFSVKACVKALVNFDKDIDELKIGNEALEAAFSELSAKYAKGAVAAVLDRLSFNTGGLSAVMPVAAAEPSSAVAPLELLQQQVEEKEKELLEVLEKIVQMRLDSYRIKHAKERVIASVLQVLIEDAPVAVVNLFYLQYGCVLGADDDDDKVAKAARGFFLINTSVSLVLSTVKFLAWWRYGSRVKEMNKNNDICIPALSGNALKLLTDIAKLKRGEELLPEEDKDALIEEQKVVIEQKDVVIEEQKAELENLKLELDEQKKMIERLKAAPVPYAGV